MILGIFFIDNLTEYLQLFIGDFNKGNYFPEMKFKDLDSVI